MTYEADWAPFSPPETGEPPSVSPAGRGEGQKRGFECGGFAAALSPHHSLPSPVCTPTRGRRGGERKGIGGGALRPPQNPSEWPLRSARITAGRFLPPQRRSQKRQRRLTHSARAPRGGRFPIGARGGGRGDQTQPEMDAYGATFAPHPTPAACGGIPSPLLTRVRRGEGVAAQLLGEG